MQQTDYKEQYNNQFVRTIQIPMRCGKPITGTAQQPISQNSKNTNKMQQTDYKEQYNNKLVRTVKIPMRCSKPITRNSTTTNQLEQ